ncbi:non-ribosomal peptide synthetase [Kitasatospora sp. A2-31]|uniref:non-ribosomal peptide synthetase n=1 Tax=Kitasatospora sp. A2-31 TaxID=2916414 RepID=UPI001EECC14F|nr:non-ribosomal peptide synthetase [Kitasatospora sp. A2-31]MCG6498018.1 amino acid adenylation domain-containing protein [Kitasatospora sp. A2-31]
MDPRLEHQDWISAIAATAAADPDRTAFEFSGREDAPAERLSYGQLDRRARAVAARLRRLGLTDRPVLLLQPPGLDYVISFVGCLYARAVAVPVYPPTRRPRSLERLVDIVADCGATVALTTAAVRDRLLPGDPDGAVMDVLRLLASDRVPEEEAEGWVRPEVGANTVAFLQYTSGSTSAPRGVVLTHGNLLHNSALIQRAFRTTGSTRGMSWLPLFHDMGLIGGMLQPLYYAGSCSLMAPTAFAQDPLRWLREISRTRATVSGGPNFAYDLCADLATPEVLAGLDLSSWEVAFNGAEPVRAETFRRFAAAYAPAGFRAEAFTPCYGLAEATLIVSCKPHGTAPARYAAPNSLLAGAAVTGAGAPGPADPSGGIAGSTELVSSGRPDASQRLEIVDPVTRRPVPAGAIGEIWLSGPSVAQGYWNRPEHSAATFGARLAADDAGGAGGPGGADGAAFLRTGDLGLLHEGELYVTGRLKDLVIVRGRNHYPQDIEQTVAAVHPALRANCGAAVQVELAGSAELVIVQEVARDHQDGDLPTLARAVREAVAESHGVRPAAVVLIRAATLPRTSSGKVQRHVCAASYREGSLAALAHNGRPQGTADERAAELDAQALRAAAPAERPALLLAALRALLGARLGLAPEELAPGQRLAELGLDSLGAVRLRHELRAALGVDLGLTEALALDLAGLAGLLAGRLDEAPAEAPESTAPGAPDPATEPGDHPLSPNQAALRLLHLIAPESPAYLVSAAFRVHGGLDPAALRTALAGLARRHAVLRSTFPGTASGPVQRVHAELPPVFEQVDAAGWNAAELAERLTAAAEQPFDLETGPLLRARLFTGAEDGDRLVLTAHHLVADLWSLSLLLEELAADYPAALRGEPVGRAANTAAAPFAAFARRQAALPTTPAGQRRLESWRTALAGVRTGTTLPADLPRPERQRMRGAAVPLTVDAATTEALTALARREGSTLYVVLLAAFQLLLARCTGESDVVVGSPTHGRTEAEFAGTVGCLVNTVPLRARIDAAEPFTALLARVRDDAGAALDGAEVPFPALVELVRPDRDQGGRPLVRSLFSLQQAPGGHAEALVAMATGRDGVPFTLGTLECSTLALPVGGSQFDLQLTLGAAAGGLAGSVRYDTDRYLPVSAERFAARFAALLAEIAADAARPVGELPLLTPAERRAVLVEGDDTALAYDPADGVVRRFEARAARTPLAVAVRSAGPGGGEQLDYGTLDRLADGVAERLRALGIGPGRTVAVLLPRTPRLLVALLGVLKSGAAYLPLDPGHPAERLALVLADGGAAAVLTDLPADRVPAGDWAVLPVDTIGEARRTADTTIHPEAAAYVLHTSGSTGRPKGVVVPHRALANLLASFERDLAPAPGSGWLSVTTPAFDIAALEYFLPLATGATVHLADAATAGDGSRLRACLEAGGVSHLQATPVTWQLLLDAGWSGTPGLTALCGGERLPAELAAGLLARGVRLWQVYGPTETTVWSVRGELTVAGGELPLGAPVANTRLHLVDPALQPVPAGVTGELLIGGDGLAHGYLGRPGLTAERFVPDPFGTEPGGRLYRTGDLVRRGPDGALLFVGRADTQVKLHGHRIELGEVETALERLPAVRRAAVVVDGEGVRARLVAFLEQHGAAQQGAAQQDPAQHGAGQEDPARERPFAAPGELREQLRRTLPGYAVPSLLVTLDALPLTANGKVDRRALPVPEAGPAAGGPADRPAGGAEPPLGPTEERIAALLAELLGTGPVGRHEDLFDRGAHSLVLARFAERARAEFGAELPLHRLFERPTVAAVAALVDAAVARPGRAGVAGRPGLTRVDRSRYAVSRGSDGALRPALAGASAGGPSTDRPSTGNPSTSGEGR